MNETQRRGKTLFHRGLPGLAALFTLLSTFLLPAAPAVAADPVITEYSAGITASAGLQRITAGPDGNLWFTELGGNKIGKITPAGVVTEYSTGITANAGLLGITAGQDGNLWFTESSANKIGKINPATGVVTEYSAGIGAGARPFGITVDLVGNLWFTESGIGKIGRITPDGVVTEYTVNPIGFIQLKDITAGPDGNLWFTESDAFGVNNLIGKITPAGVVTRYSAGISAGSGLKGITAGPDGNLWFTELAVAKIGKITPAGVVTEYSIGNNGIDLSDPNGITTGPDGNLWFTEQDGNRIGKITPDGVVTEYSAGLSASAGPYGITTSPDGNVWFTELSGNRIGTFTPPPSTPKSVTYDANNSTSGTAPIDGNSYLYPAPVTVLGNSGNLVKTGYTFAGWNSAANGSGTSYAAGATFRMGADTTLYALWAGAPTATTSAATGVTGIGATLNGTVNANGAAAAVTFDYGATTAYGTNTPATTGATVIPGTGAAAAAKSLTGLTCNTTYHYRVNGVNSVGAANGADLSFTTATCSAALSGLVVKNGATALALTPVFAGATTSYATSVASTVTSVTITPTVADTAATVTVNGVAVTSGAASAAISLAAGINSIPVVVTALDGVTTQTYTVNVTRLAADGSGTLTVSPAAATASATGQTFTFTYTAATGGMSGGEIDITASTLGTVGSVTTSSGTVTYSSGVIKVTGLTLAGGETATITWSGAKIVAATGVKTISAKQKSTSGGTLKALAPLPTVAVGKAPTATTGSPATGVNGTEATLKGTVVDNGAETTVSFDYGLTNTYGSTIAATTNGTIAAGAGSKVASVNLSGLTCGGTTYHYRVVGVNASGTTNGLDKTFTTKNDCPPAITTPIVSAGANMATLTLQSDSAGTGYFTILPGNDATCGTAIQTKAGQDANGAAALRIGSLALTANTPASYTVANLKESTAYTVCFTADKNSTLATPASANITTQAMASFANPGWSAAGTAGFSAGLASYTSLAFAPDGTAYVAYTDYGNGGKATVMKYDGTAWSAAGTAGFSVGTVKRTSLAFAPDGTPYLAYIDVGNSSKATVMKLVGAAWVEVVSSIALDSYSKNTSLAFAPDGTPYVSYSNLNYQYKVMKYNGTAWGAVGTAGFSTGTGDYSGDYAPLAFAPDGTPYMAYVDGNNGGKATVMKYNDTAWVTVGAAGPAGISAGSASYPALTFAPDGTPYVAYQDGGNGSKATVMKYDGTNWVAVGAAGFSAGVASSTSLAFAPDGTPYLAYSDFGNGTKATVMKYNGAAWVAVGKAGFSASQAISNSLAFAPDGTPYVAYSDGSNNSFKATVMRLGNVVLAPTVAAVAASSITATGATLNGTVSANGASSTVSFDYGTTTGYGTNIAATQSPVTTNGVSVSVPITDLACGTPYHFRAKGVNSIGTTNGSDLTFTTAACPPTVTTGAAATTSTGLTLNGTVNPRSLATTVSFEYGATTGYGSTVAATQSPLAAGTANAAVSVPITGFTCGSATYHFRVNAANSGGTTNGNDQTFTFPCAPAISAPVAASVGANMATLTLQADASGTGWFTLLAGNNAACGTGTQVRGGQDASGAAAFRIGSLPLTANTPGSYTVRNLAAATPYTVCFTADKGGDAAAPLPVNLTTQAMATYGAPAWSAASPAGFSAGSANSTSLAFAPDGTPYVAYNDSSTSKATVMKYNGAAWVAAGSADFSAGQAENISLAFAPDGTPYLAYKDNGNVTKATVMKFDGTAWVAAGSVGFSAGQVNFTSLAFAPDGTPYVAYRDGSNDGKATVMKYNGTAWVAAGSAGFTAGGAQYTSLAFAPDGTPYLAFMDGVNNYKATVMKYNGTAWVAAGPAGFSAGYAYYNSLAFAPDGTPYVAYQDGGNGGKATVMKYDGTAWVAVGSAGFSASKASYASLAFAPDGTPYLAYQNTGDGNGKATVMKFDGTAWVAAGPADFTAGVASYPSLAFAPDGTPYLAYKDNSKSGKATVMRLRNSVAAPTATTGAATSLSATGATLNATVSPNGATTTVSFDYGTTTAYGTNLPATTGATVTTGSDPTAASVTLSGLTCNTSYHFRVIAVNSAGAVNGSDATFTTSACPAAPAISTNPANATVNSGANTSFTVSATGDGLTYQWQVNTGTGFTNITNGGVYSNATTNTLSITGATAAMNNYSYQVVVTGSASPAATSTGATLTVNTPPAITTQPISARVQASGAASFTVVASGAGPLTYQWQVNTGSGFTDISNGGVYGGATTATLAITGAPLSMDGYTYRVVVSGGITPAATSSSVGLTVSAVNFPITSSISSTATANWGAPWSAFGGDARFSDLGTDKLVLTEAVDNQKGFVFFTEPFSATLGINATFDYYSGGGTNPGADGLSFFLIDGSYSPTAAGQSGGPLGYGTANADGSGGLVGGWVGIGFDEWGNFSAASGGPNGSPPGRDNQSVTIRGKAPTYNYITKGNPSFTIDGGNRKVNITVDKTQHITVQISNNSGSTWETVINNVSLGQAAPTFFKLGFAGSTGGSNNIHRISNVVVTLPGDDSIAGSGLAATAGAGSTVSFNLQVCPQNTTDLQTDNKATVTITPTGLSLAQTSYGPYDLSNGCVDVPISATVTAAGGNPYSYSATVSSADAGFGDVDLTNNSATQSGAVLAAPTATTGEASGITATGATLNGTVNSNNADTTVSFDYGTTTGYGTNLAATTFPAIASGAGAKAVAVSITGLTCNTTYHFRVKGVSIGGATNGGDLTLLTSACVPGAPAISTVTAGDTQATVTFSAPAANGSAITGYTATSSPGGLTATGAASPLTVTGLTNGVTYTFTVTAANGAGTGSPSAASNGVTPKGNQTIGAITFTPNALTFGGTTMASAQATSSLETSYNSTTTGVCTVNGAAITGIAIGTCTITADQGGDATWNAAPQVSQSITVTKATQTVSFANPTVTKGYGAADFGPGATASTGLGLTYDSNNTAVATITGGGLIHIVGAGTATITATQAGDETHFAASATMALTVNKAALTVTADNATRAYAAAEPAFSATYSGFVNGETAATALTGSPAFTTDAVNSSPPGSYTITPSAGNLSAANYSFTFVPGTLAVGVEAQNITFNPIPAKSYGAANFDLTAIGGASGLPVAFTSSNTAVATVNGSTVTIVGAGQTVITASQPESPGFASASAQQTLTVNKAPLMVTAGSAERFYGQTDPPFDVTYSGFVNGQDQGVLTGTPAITTTATSTSPTGSYPITPAAGSLTAANYDFIFAPGTLAVNLALQTITFNQLPAKSYGDAAFDPGATGGGSGNPVTYSSSDPSVATASGSTITITGVGQAIITATQAGNDNYASAQAQQFLTVNQAPLSVTADNASRVYGQANPALGVTYSGLVNGDGQGVLTGTPVVATTADTTSPAGSYPITVAAGNLSSNNYSFSYANGSLTVSKAPATATLDAASLSRTYDATAKAATATTSPVGLYANMTYDGSGTAPTNTGTYSVVATISDAAYSGSTSGTLTIAKTNQSVTFPNATVTKTYGNADFGPGATATSGLEVTYASNNPAVATVTNAGFVHIAGAGTATITATQAGNANYNPASANLALTVNKATLTVTANNAARAAGAVDPVFSATYGGFVNGENVSVITGTTTFTTSATSSSPAGSYTITPVTTGLGAANYTFTSVNGALAVDIAGQTIIFNPLSAKTYGAAPFELTATGGGSGLPVTFSSSNPAVATVDGSTVTITGAGETTITASQAGNGGYAPATAQQTLVVKQATLMVTANSVSRVYNTANPVFTASYSGFVNSDDQSAITGAPAITTSAGGTSPTGSYPITPSQGTLAATNYSFIFAPGTLGVDLATQTITFNPLPAMNYGDAPFNPGATGDASGNPVAYTSSDPSVATVNGSIVTITGVGQAIITANQAGNSNYASATAQQLLTVNPATLTVTAVDADRVYGAANPAFTVRYTGFVNSEDQTKLTGAPALSTTADTASPAGSYPITVAAGNLFSNNYTFSYADGALTIGQATPVITWANPDAITYGAALGATQLNAAADVAGAFSYAPPVGTVLNAGIGQTLTATFTPADAVNYTTATGYAYISVAKAGQAITFGTAPAVNVGGSGTVSATGGGSGNAVTFSSTTPSICTVSSATVTGFAAGACTIAADQAGDANFNAAAQATQNITIGQATATVALDNLNQTFDGTAKAAFATTIPFGLTVNITYDGSATAPTNAGTYPIVATINDANYTGTASGTLTIAKANQSITFANSTVAKNYGNADFGPGATASTGLPVTYASDNPAVTTITNNGLLHITGAGSTVITATQAGDGNYNPATANQTLTVNKATLTVTANNASRAFGADDPGFSAGYSGFVNGESATAITGSPTFTTNADSTSPVGSYQITPALGTLSAANYSFTYAPGTLAVGIASQSIVFNPLPASTYGAASFDLTATGGGSGNPVTFSSSNPAVATVGGSTVTIVGAGQTTITATQAGNTNYASATAQQTLTINPATLMVSAVNAQRVYGTPNPAFSVTYAGFVNGEDQAVLSGAPAVTTTATITSTVGSYPITPAAGTLTAANYNFIFAPATLAVDIASQNISFSQIAAKTYGASPFDLTATGGGSGNPITFTSTNPAVATISGATVTITGSGQTIIIANQEGNTNYASATAQQLLTVNPATVTVTAVNASRVYGAVNPALSVTYSGFVNNEDQSKLAGAPVLAAVADTTSAVGSYPITVAAGNLFSSNYTFSYENGVLTVGQATPVITWANSAAITYGAALGNTQLNATADVAGAFSYAPPLGTVLNAGNGQTLTATFTPDDSANYTGASGNISISVAKGGQIITFGPAPAVLVGGTGTVSATGGASANTVLFSSTTPAVCTVSGATVSGIAAGTCTIAADQAGNANHDPATQATQTIQVGKLAQTITFGPLATLRLGDADTDPGASASSGLAVSYDSSNPAVATIVNNKLHVIGLGSATITASQAGNAVYLAAASVTRTLTVGYNTAPPLLIVSALSDGATTTETTQNISGKISDINGIRSVTVNGNIVHVNPDGSFSFPVQLLAGANTVTVVATNNAGATSTDTRTLNLDSTAPRLTVAYPPDNGIAYQKTITVTGTIAELLNSGKTNGKTVALPADPTLTVSYTINGSSPQTASLTETTYSFTTNLDDGMNTIRVSASNAAGKKVEAKRTVNYQLPTFSIAVTDPAADIRMVQDSYLLTGKVEDNTTEVSVTVAIDNQSFTPQVVDGVFRQQLSFNEDKTYQISVTGTDQNNNTLTVQRNIIRSVPKTAAGESAPFTIVDALQALRIAVGIITPDNSQILRMDAAPMVNGVSVGDGKVDIEDVVIILRMAVGLIQ